MQRWWSAIIAISACLPLVFLAAGVPVPWLTQGEIRAQALPVPPGDRELAWLHTTTNSATWERFVTGFQRATVQLPGLEVDDSRAFPNDTTTTPELTLGMKNRPGRLHIRWYKLSNESTHSDWVRVLANRNPAPLAVIGGGSSDRAADLARAMNAQRHWHGELPLLFITTATADNVADEQSEIDNLKSIPLEEIYKERSLRFCFTNRQIAEATVDFVWSRPEWKPGLLHVNSYESIFGGAAVQGINRPQVMILQWNDDPYSIDLREQFGKAITNYCHKYGIGVELKNTNAIPFSIGGYYSTNRHERLAIEFVIHELKTNPDQRFLLVLPTVTAAARRVLRTICDLVPDAGKRMVVVNGDGIPMNAIYRDGEFAWPADSIPVPLILFSHADPIRWDTDLTSVPEGYELLAPTSTEDVLLFADIARITAKCAYPEESGLGLTLGATAFFERIRTLYPNRFDVKGNRKGGTGEYAIVYEPRDPLPNSRISVWRKREEWTLLNALPIPLHPQLRSRSGE